VGANNYRYFLALLISVSILLMYGAYLGYTILDGVLQEQIFPGSRGSPYQRHWSSGEGWSVYLQFWALAIAEDLRIGGVFLLAMLTTPLPSTFFLYHLYLIWSGMTTNESAKWADWRDDINDGLVFKAKRTQIYGKPLGGNAEPDISWPVDCDQTLVFTNGEPPKFGCLPSIGLNTIIQPSNPDAPTDPSWTKVRGLRDVVNVYDLGFWKNLRDAVRVL